MDKIAHKNQTKYRKKGSDKKIAHQLRHEIRKKWDKKSDKKLKKKSKENPISLPEKHIPTVIIMCSPTWETHIPSDMCFPNRETQIPSDNYVFPYQGNTYPQ